MFIVPEKMAYPQRQASHFSQIKSINDIQKADHLITAGLLSDIYSYDHHMIVKSVHKWNQTIDVIHFNGPSPDEKIKAKIMQTIYAFSDLTDKNLRKVIYKTKSLLLS